MASSRVKLDELREQMAVAVDNYLSKKLYSGEEGRERAEMYGKKLAEYYDQILVSSATADFLQADSVLGSSKRLRRMIGEALCEFYGVEAQLVTDKVTERSTYSLVLFSVQWANDQTYVDVMRDLLKRRIHANEKTLAHQRLLEDVAERLSAKSSEEKATSLRDRITEVDGGYADSLKSVEDGALVKQLMTDLHDKKIALPAPIINAIIDDYKMRLIQKNYARDCASIVSCIESAKFQLENNVTISSFNVDKWAEEVMADKLQEPLVKISLGFGLR